MRDRRSWCHLLSLIHEWNRSSCLVVVRSFWQFSNKHRAVTTQVSIRAASWILNKCLVGATKTLLVIVAMNIASSSSIDTTASYGVGHRAPPLQAI